MITVLEFINKRIEASSEKELTYEEWCHIRQTGSPEEIQEAVERMMAQGGYDNLA